MTRLALLAALLVAFAPAVSRLLAGHGALPASQLTELCTSAGLQLADVGKLFAGHATQGHEVPPAAPHHGEDGNACDYCTLAATLSLPLLAPHAVAPQLVAASEPLLPSPRLKAIANLRGLGGQGPPILL